MVAGTITESTISFLCLPVSSIIHRVNQVNQSSEQKLGCAHALTQFDYTYDRANNLALEPIIQITTITAHYPELAVKI